MSGIKIDPTPIFSMAYFEIDSYEGEIDEDANIEISVGCGCGSIATLALRADQLQEVVDAARKFRDRRDGYKAWPARA